MKKVIKAFIAVLLVVSLSGCALFDSVVKDIKGELIGNEFDISFYDNGGENILNAHGKKVGVEGNTVKTVGINSDGSTTTNYELSSVITITVDGKNMEQTGNTVVFAETGIKKITDIEVPKEIESSGEDGTVNIIDRTVNQYKNMIGTPKIVVVCSQLGVPIAIYGGESVYWEVPDDLPKMTKLNIDGKALYIHRANYVMMDTALL